MATPKFIGRKVYKTAIECKYNYQSKMFFSTLSFALLSLFSAETPQGNSQNHYNDLTGAQNGMINHQQVQDTLNNQLRGGGDVHANADRMAAYITGADSQIDNAIATSSKASTCSSHRRTERSNWQCSAWTFRSVRYQRCGGLPVQYGWWSCRPNGR